MKRASPLASSGQGRQRQRSLLRGRFGSGNAEQESLAEAKKHGVKVLTEDEWLKLIAR